MSLHYLVKLENRVFVKIMLEKRNKNFCLFTLILLIEKNATF